MDKSLLIQELSKLLLKGKKDECCDLASELYPFTEIQSVKRQYSKYQMCKIFLRDGFIDRYSGTRLIFPGLIKILSLELPEVFRYHKNWKMAETHIIYWELFPTIDHLLPITRGGADNEDNWITTSMIHNSSKANWTIAELGWILRDKGNLAEWDGLISCFIEITRKNPKYEVDSYVKGWKIALLKAQFALSKV